LFRDFLVPAVTTGRHQGRAFSRIFEPASPIPFDASYLESEVSGNLGAFGCVCTSVRLATCGSHEKGEPLSRLARTR